MTDHELMGQALRALDRLTRQDHDETMQYSDILLVMIALRERLEKPESRQLQWAKAQADYWKQHCFFLMKKLQEKEAGHG